MPNVNKRIEDIMSTEPATLPEDSTLAEAARMMRDEDIGGVIVTRQDGRVSGFLTDRDIVVRGLADGKDPETTTLAEVCSQDLVQLSPNSSIEEAIETMRDRSVRRIPVVDNGRAVGLISLGDLAREQDPQSVLGQISAAPPNH